MVTRQAKTKRALLIGRAETIDDLRASALGEREGVLLRGAAGSGKSATLAAVAPEVCRQVTAIELSGSPTSRTIDFAVVAPLLELDALSALSGVQLLAKVRHAVTELDCAGPPVVLLDDVDHVDDASATVLSQLIQAREITFIGTLRSAVAVPGWMRDLIQRQVVRSQVLPALDRAASDAIVRDRVGGDVAAEVVEELWSLGAGNPLCLLELIDAGVETGELKRIGGTWELDGVLPLSGMLADRIDARLSALGLQARDALDVVSLIDDAELAVIERVVETSALTELERSGLLGVAERGSRVTVTITDPLVRRRCLQQLPTTQRRAVARLLASTIAATGARRSGDALRVADWAFDSGEHSEPAVLIIAAAEALRRGDQVKAARMVDAAIDNGGGFAAQCVAAQVYGARRLWAEAEVAAMTAASLATSDEEVTEAVVVHSRLLVSGGGTLVEAQALVLAAAERVSFGPAQERLEVEHARLAVIAGDLEEALELVARSTEPTTRSLALERLALTAHVLHVGGRFRAAIEHVDAALGDIADVSGAHLGDPEPLVELISAQRCEAMLMAGEVEAASKVITEGLARSQNRRDRTPKGLWLYLQARLTAMQGNASLAADHIALSVHSLSDLDLFGRLELATARWALMAAQAGDRHQCENALALIRSDIDSRALVPGLLIARAHAWLAASADQHEVAVTHLEEVASRALTSGHLTLAADAAFDAVRLGGASTVVDLLEAVAPLCESDLIADWAVHARAIVDADLARLEELSLRYAKRGLMVVAAEVALHAEGALDQAEREKGGRFRVRAETLLAGGATAPAAASAVTLLQQQKPVLTSRQAQIARLAIECSNSEIAQELSISIRTVENHLNAAFQRLGVHSRTELAHVFTVSGAN